jgi:hypothetical protein
MQKVICNAIGSVPGLCNGCGAASLHYKTYCEPCPVNKNARCIPASDPPGENLEEFGKKSLSEIAFLLTS